MLKKLYISLLIFLGFFMSCQKLDIPPTNILTDEDIYNEGGITAYMASLYGHIPMEDFNTSADGGSKQGFYNWNCIQWDMLSTGETVNRNNTGIFHPTQNYWSEGYKVIRSANKLIKNLPGYIGVLNGAEEWIAEAKFIRAYVYFALVKRYGGVPLLETPQDLASDPSELWIARSSHEESYDLILSDLDYAIENLSRTKVNGRANKYVAAALKSKVALFAGTIARYGNTFSYTGKSGVVLCGLPASRANEYFKQAWDASKIVEEGGYELYQNESNLTENYADIWEEADNSKESIFIRQYDPVAYRHSFDVVYCPPRMTSTYGDRYNVTLDWVELFDGLPIDPTTGRIKTVDDANNYIVYDSPQALYENAEPRLRANILLPGNTYKSVEVDIRRGIIDESIDPSTPIQKFVPDDGATTTGYNHVDWFNNNVLTTTEKVTAQTSITTSNGVNLNRNGLDGPANGGSQNTLTGFHGRKWLDLEHWTPAATDLHKSYQTWIDMRYAEVLLNRAEAALELAQNGEANYSGVDMRTDAYECINMIRERAGATLLAGPDELSAIPAFERGTGVKSFVSAPNRGLQLVRVERYKELAFEHKLYWDIRRWFTADKQIYNYRRRMLNPFLFAKGATVNEAGNPEGKYIYDARVCERANNNLIFDTKYYYFQIPTGQINDNPLLEQNNQW